MRSGKERGKLLMDLILKYQSNCSFEIFNKSVVFCYWVGQGTEPDAGLGYWRKIEVCKLGEGE